MCTRKDLEEVASQMVEKFKEQLLIDLKDEFTKIVDSKFNDLKTEIAEIRKENQHLKECIASANEARDELEQYGRRSMLEIHDEEKANALNNYFSSISNVNDSSSTLPRSNLKTNYCLNELTINEQEVIDILENLDVNKSTRPDQISQRMLKETGYRDHEGGSPRKRPSHCTSVGLTPAIATNVGYSASQRPSVHCFANGLSLRWPPCGPRDHTSPRTAASRWNHLRAIPFDEE
ncbi:hypothetical protein MAR_016544 [Mya arenaria]|uniref:Uncharacterized protein n=1 Tax=Mya arenaria TaxID=6604 RepID=A0ABY7FK38_MYAAR|nr:hypothetical protein MAR_016544 [Mya arenaria]